MFAACLVLVSSVACDSAGDGEGGSTSASNTSSSVGGESTSEGSSSTTGEGGGDADGTGATSTGTGGAELPMCIGDTAALAVGSSINGNSESDVEFWSHVLTSTTCIPGAAEVSTGSDGLIRTTMTLDCSPPRPKKGEDAGVFLDVTVRGYTVDLGPDPVEVSYQGEPAGEEYPIPSYRFVVERNDRILLFTGSGGSALGLETVAEEELCAHGLDECGHVRGVEGVTPDGDPIRQHNGEAVEMAVADHTMLVAARGVEFDTCPGEEEEVFDDPGWLEVNAINPDVIASR